MVRSLQSMFYTERNFLFFQLTFLDMIMYIIFKESELPVHTIRWTRVFRPLFLVNISEARQVKIVIACSRRSDSRWQCKVKKARKNRGGMENWNFFYLILKITWLYMTVLWFLDLFQIRRAFRNIRKLLPEIANVLILLLLIIALFSLLGCNLFGKRYFRS